MTAAPGWYPDPGGRGDLVRWWDGRSWTAATRPKHPAGPPPPGRPRQRSPIGWIVGIAAVLVALVVVVVLLVVNSVRPSLPPNPFDPTPATPGCPEAVQPTSSPAPAPDAERVVSGRLSYPVLLPPFERPQWDRRVPFGRDVRNQQATVESDANGAPTWVASVVIARLLAGDGFYGPQQGAEVVTNCIIGVFYRGAAVERTDRVNKATSVDGRDAWIIESHLSFDLPDIETKGETMTVVVVATTEGEAGLFYASNPDTSPQFAEPLEAARTGLRVS